MKLLVVVIVAVFVTLMAGSWLAAGQARPVFLRAPADTMDVSCCRPRGAAPAERRP